MQKILGLVLFALCVISFSSYAKPVKVPDFSLPSTNGSVSPESIAGKVVYLDFWASWCKPCVKSFPWLNQMQKKYKDKGLMILAINLDKDKNLADEFLQRLPAEFTVAFDKEGVTPSLFKVSAMPSSYLVDSNGFIRGRHIGFREKDKANLEKAIASLLKH